MTDPSENVCPFCSDTCKTRNHLREHIEERHRKSEIIDAYLEAIGK